MKGEPPSTAARFQGSDALVQRSVRDGVGLVTLNRPEKRNAMTPEMFDLFNAAMRSHQSDPAVNAILIVASGGAFCAGGDLSMIAEAKRGAISSDNLDLDFYQPGVITKPIVCGVVGACVGEGVAILLASDLVICGTSARFALPEVSLGIPPVDIPLLAARRLNSIHMLEILLTGAWKDATWADKVGLVNEVVADDAVAETAFDLARRVAAAPAPAAALVKFLIHAAATSSDAPALRRQGAAARTEIQENLKG